MLADLVQRGRQKSGDQTAATMSPIRTGTADPVHGPAVGTRRLVEETQGREHDVTVTAVGDPELAGRRLQVTPVEFRVRTGLLHDEDVDPKPQDPVQRRRVDVGSRTAMYLWSLMFLRLRLMCRG